MAVTAVRVTAGETVVLRFRAETPGGAVVRPPAATEVTVSRGGHLFAFAAPEAAWDGREWSVSLSTGDWPHGTYDAVVTVTGGHGKGLAQAEITVTP